MFLKIAKRVGLTLLWLAMSHGQVIGQSVDAVLEEEVVYQQSAQQSQRLVEDLDSETLAMVSAYNRELERYDDLVTYNENLRQLIENQQQEKARIQQELEEVAVVQQDIVPLMVEMVEVLDQFLALDKPLLVNEREARLQSLRSVLTRSDVELSEKYRRVVEAYLIEAEYGQTLEVYEDQVELDGREVTVDLLRVGRVALYYVSLDRQFAGIWDASAGQFVALSAEYLEDLDSAIRIAREQAPPNLINLPMWTGEGR